VNSRGSVKHGRPLEKWLLAPRPKAFAYNLDILPLNYATIAETPIIALGKVV
jgi:hypothetical protein